MPANVTGFGEFMAVNGDVKFVDAIFADLSGIIRGKRLPIAEVPALYRSGIRFPASVMLLAVTGNSLDPLGRGVSDGDPDAIARPIESTLVRVPWVSDGL